MYYNFNETNVITGYIKELLRDFNLPVYTVYRGAKKLHDGKIYLKDGNIVKYTNSTFVSLDRFLDNKANFNFTKNLIINSSVYDSYTHTYLGDYLRFLRDYKGINLMPLYNCFNTESPVGLNYGVKITSGEKSYNYIIDTTDSNYNYYIVPAKFDEVYTININALMPYEISCIIYTGDKQLDISKELSKITYKRINTTSAKQVDLYSTTIDESKFSILDYSNLYWRYEDSLRLLIKIPKRFNSSITILEGDYRYSKAICGNTLIAKSYLDDKSNYIDAISKLSLLEDMSSVSHPFADRLVEYLLGNVITNQETIENNVERVQTLLKKNLQFENTEGSETQLSKWIFKGYNDNWDEYLRLTILRKLESVSDVLNLELQSTANKKKSYYQIYSYDHNATGSDPKYIPSKEDYDYFRPVDMYYDLLGYVDKDTEQNLCVNTVVNTNKVKEI